MKSAEVESRRITDCWSTWCHSKEERKKEKERKKKERKREKEMITCNFFSIQFVDITKERKKKKNGTIKYRLYFNISSTCFTVTPQDDMLQFDRSLSGKLIPRNQVRQRVSVSIFAHSLHSPRSSSASGVVSLRT